MITADFVVYALVALAVVGILYVTVFQKGPETAEDFRPSYGKAKEDTTNTAQR